MSWVTEGKRTDKSNCLKGGFPQKKKGRLKDSGTVLSWAKRAGWRDFTRNTQCGRGNNASSLHKATNMFPSFPSKAQELLSVFLPFLFHFWLIRNEGKVKDCFFNKVFDYASWSTDEMKKIPLESIFLPQSSVASILYIMFNKKKTGLFQIM